jgi:hypothetical protein
VKFLVSGLKLVDATIDRAPRKARRKRSCRDTTKSKGQSFIGRKQTPAALVKKRSRQLPARPDFIKVNHGLSLSPGYRVAPTKFAIPFLRFQSTVDSIILPQALSYRLPCSRSGMIVEHTLEDVIKLWFSQNATGPIFHVDDADGLDKDQAQGEGRE